MNPLRIIVIIACFIFVALVFRQVASGRLLLRYSLLWLALALVTALAALFPEPVFSLAIFLGFDVPSNFIFFVALFFLLAISLSLSVVVSRQSQKIKGLVQSLALFEQEIREQKDLE